ncbi:MAG TPA: hypothetical protein VK213_07060 [Bacteroidales bacterium]|nr:hypothetical protein [Bacteroidales bacterium]
MKTGGLVILLYLCLAIPVMSQDEPSKVDLNGYASTVTSSMFESVNDPFIIDNLIHNRLNLKAYLGNNITFALELRNRLFAGDMVRSGLGYAELTGDDKGFADLSWNLVSKHSFFLNTTADRLWVDFNYGSIQARVGRQRINWGQALIWNPNDIFNAYSYFDFDYIERPGSDAVRVQYYVSSSDVLDFAIKADYQNDVTAALLYRFNKWSYDIQLLGGIYDSDEIVAGAGWSGAIKSISFRGEATWFQPFENTNNEIGKLIITSGFDKIFQNNSMVQLQLMLCNDPLDLHDFSSLYTRDMTVEDLAFSVFTAFASYSYPVTPLFTTGISVIWFPGIQGYFGGLSADYSLAENVDASLLWQHFRGDLTGTASKINIAFLRIKFSF